MKRTLWILVGIVAIPALAVPLSNLFSAPPQVAFLESESVREAPELATVFAAKCADCHTDAGRRPFYTALPVAGDLIRRDVEQGLARFDLDEALLAEGPPSEAALAKLEHTLTQGEMPPGRYVLLHWNGGLSDAEREQMLSWVRALRVKHYAPEGLPREVAERAVHPIPPEPQADPAKVALGLRLFHDPRLSGDDSLSCASCHSLTLGGADARPVSVGIGGAEGPINSPTVFNAVFNTAQFWDGRAADLAEQAGGPVHNPIEMGSNWDEVIGKLSQDEAFVADYTAIYGEELTGENLQDAIAVFESTLVTPDSPFDRFLMGEADAIPAEARRGWEVFQQAGCVTCHAGKALGGTSFEKMGLEDDYFAARGDVQEVDLGRFNVTQAERDRHRFKVPVLRNIALTAPYFHDASAETLEDAVRTMARYQTDVTLTEGDVADVVSFLESLTGQYRGRSLN